MHDDGHRNGSLVQMEEPTAAESVIIRHSFLCEPAPQIQ